MALACWMAMLGSRRASCWILSASSSRAAAPTKAYNGTSPDAAATTVVSVALATARPRPSTASERLWRLWNDKRSISDVIRDGRRSNDDDAGHADSVPYCIVSDEFAATGGLKFRVLLYPRGVFSSSQASDSAPASAYLSFVPDESGVEVDACWRLRLVDGATGESIPIGTSGGLPRSTDTWSSAMTFCSRAEAVDTVGRAGTDWGSSSWSSRDVLESLADLRAEVELTVMGSRRGQSSLSLPPRGGLGASIRAAAASAGTDDGVRTFRAGEVIVAIPKTEEQKAELERMGVYEGVDYRVMTLADGQGNEIFDTESLPEEERLRAKLAIRPLGWKLQKAVWDSRGYGDWPTEVSASDLSPVALSRFSPTASLPRLVSFLTTQDFRSLVVAATLAFSPVPLALVGREFFSFYAIPSASMDPTLRNGDVLVVEKFPHIFDRIHRGDIVLFRPPPALQDIIQRSGGGTRISRNQLFVKRIVGMPGDERISMDGITQEVRISNVPAVGPKSRALCDDEPLRLIDKLLEDGKGIDVDSLGDDEAYVLGDCKAVSVDSRVFGTLPKRNIVGKPIGRIWPPQRFKLGSP